MRILGTLKKKFPIESGTSKKGKEWKKQSILIEQNNEYNKDVVISAFGEERIRDLENLELGMYIEVKCYVSSREFNGKWYHNIDGWTFTNKTDAEEIEENNDLPF